LPTAIRKGIIRTAEGESRYRLPGGLMLSAWQVFFLRLAVCEVGEVIPTAWVYFVLALRQSHG